jgi:hypothetical protein
VIDNTPINVSAQLEQTNGIPNKIGIVFTEPEKNHEKKCTHAKSPQVTLTCTRAQCFHIIPKRIRKQKELIMPINQINNGYCCQYNSCIKKIACYT